MRFLFLVRFVVEREHVQLIGRRRRPIAIERHAVVVCQTRPAVGEVGPGRQDGPARRPGFSVAAQGHAAACGGGEGERFGIPVGPALAREKVGALPVVEKES